MRIIDNIRGRVKNRSTANLFTGLIYQIISIGMGLILPYLFITNLGSESNGLLNSVGHIFMCLGLLEAGVATTTIQALYRPIANKDCDSINGILAATHQYYLKTGLWYAIAVAGLTAVYPLFVDSALSSSTIRWVIALHGIGAVVSYLFQAKYSLLLRAEGRNYILTTLSLVILLIRNFGKIFAIKLGYNIVAVQAIQLVTILIEASFILLYVKKHYPWLTVKTEADYAAISQKKSVFAQSVAWMVFNHTDVLVLTIFTRNLALISIYSVYALVFEAAQNLTSQIRDSFQYKIGNKAQHDVEALSLYFANYGIKILFLIFAIYSLVYLMSSPFVSLYTANAHDAQYDVAWVPELFFLYKLLYGFRAMYRQLIEANGHFKQTEHIAIIEAFTNALVSVALVKWLGIVGVLIGTVFSLVISTTLYIRYIYKSVLPKAVLTHLEFTVMCLPIMIASVIAGKRRVIFPSSWTGILFAAVLTGVFLLILYGICYRLQACRAKQDKQNG